LLLESSELAAVSIALIPFYLWVRKHTILLPKSRLLDIGCYGMIGIAILCAIGTYARTALVGFVVVGVFLFLQSRRKIVFALVATALVIGFGATTSSSWNERIATTSDYEDESSALGRILVWKWTLDYVSEHPLGGGFNSYFINKIALPVQPGQPEAFMTGKAFHNSYFEVLGEQGYPGLAMFVTILAITFGYLWTVIRRTKKQPHMAWLRDLAMSMLTSLLTLLACASFIGIGFQPVMWYLIALPVCLREYLRRVEDLEKKAELPPYLRGRAQVDPGMLPRPVH
jgi:probable O-glycosylation ligase (exosortase A-associated)